MPGNSRSKHVLVAGAAGFIGAKTCESLLRSGFRVTGIDNLNDYYDPRVKRHRLAALKRKSGFTFIKADIEDPRALERVFKSRRVGSVINLAARAGVRYSIENPAVYVSTNMMGTLNLLEACRRHGVKKYALASTSSLYTRAAGPSDETSETSLPISPYAATKKGAEALAHAYHHLYGMDVAVLRYFTVYGPAGRPDMSPFLFTQKILNGRPITVFGDGRQRRDFTYVDDIARGTVAALRLKGYQVINLGGDQPYPLQKLIRLIEREAGAKARIVHKASHPADIRNTWASIRRARALLGWTPRVSLEEGVRRTVLWHKQNAKWLGRT